MAEYIERNAADKALTISAANDKDKNRRTWAKAICVLHDLPAADVAPVVHGRWVAIRENELSGWQPELACCKPIGGYFCSRCRCEAVYSYNGKYVLSSFCPNCGARMDGGDYDDKSRDT